jgi:hypothetical protein
LVIARGPDGIGSADLETILREISEDPSWIHDIFKSQSARPVYIMNDNNSRIAEIAMRKVLLARWIIFRLFIIEARNQGRSVDDDLKQDWLYFQILPPRINGRDPFKELIDEYLPGVTPWLLRSLEAELSPWDILSSDFKEKFYYVLDEIQVAGTQYLSCFNDGSSSTCARPVLSPILRRLKMGRSYPIIASGTGFSLPHFDTSGASSVGKFFDWETKYSTGDFTDPAIQSSYVSRYLPASYLNSPSGLALMKRMHRWLRGRYVITSCQTKTHRIYPFQAHIYGSFH